MSDENKPRVFGINSFGVTINSKTLVTLAFEMNEGQNYDGEFIKTVEYSALEQANARIKALRETLRLMADTDEPATYSFISKAREALAKDGSD